MLHLFWGNKLVSFGKDKWIGRKQCLIVINTHWNSRYVSDEDTKYFISASRKINNDENIFETETVTEITDSQLKISER